MGKTAVVFGVTGLVGHSLLKQLENDSKYSAIKVFVRRPIEVSLKTKVIVSDFKELENISSQIVGDEVFCCIGTTIKKAGSKEVFTKIDNEMVFYLARIARTNEVSHFLYISSIGANAKSSNFYLSVKGRVEQDLESLKFNRLSVFRPSFLLGDRKEFRFGEFIGKQIMNLVQYLLIGKMKKYKPVEASTVARAMIKVASIVDGNNYVIYESDKIQELGK